MTETLFRARFLPRDVIFREGEAGSAAYVIESGKVQISALRHGREAVLAKLGTGELLGELGLIEGQYRTATARALTETTLIVIHRNQLGQKLSRSDPVLDLLIKVMLERIRHTTRQINTQEPALEGAFSTQILDDAVIGKVREQVISSLQFTQDIEQALRCGQFQLVYQPIVSAKTARVHGFEALIRWNHPERGSISPGLFIGLAEEVGLIVPIGLWALEEACTALRRFGALVPGCVPFMSINLSARQMAEPNMVETFRDVIERLKVEPAHIKLEVTESLLMSDPERAAVVLHLLRELGVQLAIDDFGTGYSSLSYLNRFPFDVIKIDQSFVSTMLSDGSNQKIVKAMTMLARELNKKSVAEGVEKRREAELLREFGCDYIQGYFFSKPLRLEDAESFYLKHHP